MKRIVLIACGKKKANRKLPARELYLSPLFRLSLTWAEQLKPEAIFILSAKHGLVRLEELVEPYDKKLTKNDQKEWGEKVITQLGQQYDLNQTEIMFLTGTLYTNPLIPHLPHSIDPLAGLGIGKRLAFLKGKL